MPRPKTLYDGGASVPDAASRRPTDVSDDFSAERRLADFLEVADDWFWETDTRHQFIFVSDRFATLTGRQTETCLGLTRFDLGASTDNEAGRCHLADLAAERPFQNYVYRIETPNGSHWVSVSGKPVRDAEGRFLGYRGTGKDITREVEAERRAEQASTRLEAALFSMSEGFVLYDSDDCIVLLNDRIYDFFDPERQILRKGVLFSEAMRTMVRSKRIVAADPTPELWLEQRLDGHGAAGLSSEIELSDGRWVHVSEHPIAGGGTVGIYTDITERKRREMELETQRDVLSSIFASMPQGICITDADLVIRHVNQRYRDMLDVPDDLPMIGRPMLEVLEYVAARGEFGPQVDSDSLARYRDFISRREPYRLERRRANGNVIETRADRLSDDGMFFTLTDMTEWHEVRTTLREREERYRDLVERSPDAIFVQRGGQIRFANTGAVQMFRAQSKRHLLSCDLASLTDPAALEEVSQRNTDLMRQGLGSHCGPVIVAALRVDGEPFELEYEATAILFDGKPAVQVVARDVTERRRNEAAMREAKENAELANRTKSEFLANMSHELRTPLNAIIGFSEILRDEMFGPLGSPRYQDYVADIYESGSHLLSVINDILDLSRAEAGRVVLNEQHVDIDRLIEGSLRLVRERAARNRLKLVPDLGPCAEMTVIVDERLVKQVLINLLSNAVKFTDPEGIVTVRVRTDGAWLTFDIIDNGIGIPRDRIEDMFGAFTQGHGGLSRRYEGTGLGLALSRSLAEAHGGTLEIESQEGVGTTAHLRLPLIPGT